MERMLEQGDHTRGGMVASLRAVLPSADAALRHPSLPAVLLSGLAGIVLGLVCLISPVLAVALSLGLVVLVTSLSRPIVLCYMVIGATILLTGMERGRLFPVLKGNEISLLAAVAIALVLVLADKNRKISIPKYFWLALCLLVGGVLLIPIAIFLQQGVQLTLDNAFKMFSTVQYFLLFWLFAALPQGEGERRTIIWWMLAFAAIVAVVGLAQAAGIGVVNRLLDNFYPSSHEAVATRAGRVTSLIGAWNGLGIFMMAVGLLCWALLLEVNETGHRLFILSVLTLCILCLVASGSWAGTGGLAAGFGLILMLSRQKARSLPLLLIGLIAILPLLVLLYPFLQPLVAKRFSDQFQYGGWIPFTLLYRIQVWRTIFIPAIEAHFPWPVYPTVPSWYAWQYEESQYVSLLFRTGLVGFVSFMTWIGATIYWLYRRHRASQGLDRAIGSAALILILVLVIAGFTNAVFSYAGSIDYLWIMLALVANAKGAK